MNVQITEVRIKLMEDSDDRLQAFCSITFDDCFVVRDLKIIEGATGPFVAMPSRKLTAHCPNCRSKNHLRANYCNQCGSRLKEEATRDSEGRTKLYADIAHPINSQCREMIQNRVIAEFQAELARSREPGYVSRYEDDYFDDDFDPPPVTEGEASSAASNEDAADSPPEGEQPSGGPPGPHKKPTSQQRKRGQRPPDKKQDTDDFGAGIF